MGGEKERLAEKDGLVRKETKRTIYNGNNNCFIYIPQVNKTAVWCVADNTQNIYRLFQTCQNLSNHQPTAT